MNNKKKNLEQDEVLDDIYNEEDEVEIRRKNKIRKQWWNENSITIVTIILGVSTLFFGFYQITSHIRGPFKKDSNSAVLAELNQDLSLDDLMGKDTDKDGLPDYDEENLYGTSPYLEDTDSDKILDYEEIKGGTDPNCGAGQNCGSEAVYENPTGAAAEPAGSADVEQLRQILREAGMTEEMLSQFSDDEIISTYLAVAAEKESGELSAEEIQNLSLDEVRQLLISKGIDADLVNQMSDEELRQIVEESVK